jgi:hypothetical protein
MRNPISYDNLTNRCKEIIRNKNPKMAVNLISNLKLENGTRVGRDTAKKIYNIYINDSVTYEPNKYGNNISEYSNKLKKNSNEVNKK